MASSSDSFPRCVVLPLVGKDGRSSHAGLALHFLLGNVVVLYPAFQEFWFGWRIAKIFPAPKDLTSYCRIGTPDPAPFQAGKREDIRFWIAGVLAGEPDCLSAELSLFDAETENREPSPAMAVDIDGGLIGFRKQFIAWLENCGHRLSAEQQEKALWPEEVSEEGLAAIGRALEGFYLQSAYGGKAPVDLPPFETAAAEAPAAFMAHDLLGWARYRNQEYAKSREAFVESVRINPHGAGAMAGLIWCGVMMQDSKEVEYWASRKAASCDGDAGKAREKALKLLEKYKRG